MLKSTNQHKVAIFKFYETVIQPKTPSTELSLSNSSKISIASNMIQNAPSNSTANFTKNPPSIAMNCFKDTFNTQYTAVAIAQIIFFSHNSPIEPFFLLFLQHTSILCLFHSLRLYKRIGKKKLKIKQINFVLPLIFSSTLKRLFLYSFLNRNGRRR